MDFTRALVTIQGTAPYSQSHQHGEPMLEGEGAGDYDTRTWRSKMNTEIIDGRRTMVIPAFGIQMSLVDAAKYSKRQIPGQSKATWTAKFASGIMIMGHANLNVDPDTVQCIVLSVNSDGKRGSAHRVTRRFPQIPAGWIATFEVLVIDPIITEGIFREMLEIAGLFVGVGQYRPARGGSNGRFITKAIKWEDNRQLVKKAA